VSEHLSDVLGAPVHLKLENLQRTGSFKIRGATYRLSRLTAEERARGVVAASAGNHAQGVALAAQKLGIPATIFMPLGVPVPKLLATRGYGAEVILEGATVETPLRLAAEFAERTGAVLIPPSTTATSSSGRGPSASELWDASRARDRRRRHRRRRTDRRGRRRREGARSPRGQHRSDHRRAGGELRRVPVLPRRRRAADGCHDADDRRRHRRRPPGDAPFG
jgi:hypothetical protein